MLLRTARWKKVPNLNHLDNYLQHRRRPVSPPHQVDDIVSMIRLGCALDLGFQIQWLSSISARYIMPICISGVQYVGSVCSVSFVARVDCSTRQAWWKDDDRLNKAYCRVNAFTVSAFQCLKFISHASNCVLYSSRPSIRAHTTACSCRSTPHLGNFTRQRLT
jgi:hypothetical protein